MTKEIVPAAPFRGVSIFFFLFTDIEGAWLQLLVPHVDINHPEKATVLVLEQEADNIWINQANQRKTWLYPWKATVASAKKTEELLCSHGGAEIHCPSAFMDVIQSPCFYGERRTFGKNTDELNDASVSDTDRAQRVRFVRILVQAQETSKPC